MNLTRADDRFYLKSQTDAKDTAAIAAALSQIRAGVATAYNDLSKIVTELLAIKGIVGGITPDGDDIINRLNEVYTVMNGFSESVSLIGQFGDLQLAVNSLENSLADLFSNTLPNLVRLNFDNIRLSPRQIPGTDGDGNLIDSSITDKDDGISFNDKRFSGFSADIKIVESNSNFAFDGYIFQPEDNGKILEFFYSPNNLFFYEGTVSYEINGYPYDVEFPILPDGFNCLIVMTDDASPIFQANQLTLVSKSGKTQIDGLDATVSIYKNANTGKLRLSGDLR